MFGYVVPYKPELKIKEYDFYKAIYCGVCRQMGRRSGCISRMFLSYDSVFMALTHLSISGDDYKITEGRCVVNPIKNVKFLDSKYIDYCADISVLLVWHKIKDDINDNGFPKNILAHLLSLIMRNAHFRAMKNVPGADERIARSMQELSVIEKKRSPSMDEASETFHSMLADISENGVEGESEKRIAREIGMNIGRWIYIMDAFNDIPEDIKSGDYNPLVLRYKMTKDETASDFQKRIRDEVDSTLALNIHFLSRAAELCKAENPVIDNVINMGLRQKQFSILYKDEFEEELKRRNQDGSL